MACARAEVLSARRSPRRSRSFQPHAAEKEEGQAPEGEPFFWRQPSCRPAISRPAVPGCLSRRAPARPRPGGWPPRVFAGPDIIPMAQTRRRPDERARFRPPKWDSNAVLCGTWQNPAAIAQEHRSLLCRGQKGTERRRSKLMASAFAARSSAMSGGSKWTTAGAQAQWYCQSRRPRIGACGGLSRVDARGRKPRLEDRFEGKCPGLRIAVEGSQQFGNPTGATTHQT